MAAPTGIPDAPRPVQLHLQLAYKFDPIHHPAVRDLLARGWRIAEFQRVTDREALVTLVPEPPAPV